MLNRKFAFNKSTPRELQRAQTPLSRSYIEIWAPLIDRSYIEFACFNLFYPNSSQSLPTRSCVEVDHLGLQASDHDALGHRVSEYAVETLQISIDCERAIVTYLDSLRHDFYRIEQARREFTAFPDAFTRLCIVFFFLSSFFRFPYSWETRTLSRATSTLHNRGNSDDGGDDGDNNAATTATIPSSVESRNRRVE